MFFMAEKGAEGLLDGTLDLDTHTLKWILLDLAAADTGIKAISGATNATPVVVTATAHGYSNGDIVYIDGVAGNLAANGLWKIASVAANTFELQRLDGTNVTGSGAYTSGGYAVCLGPSTSGDNIDDFDGARVGTDVTLTSPTVTNGAFDAADPTWSAVTGATVEAIGLYRDTGTASTSRVLGIITGKFVVRVAAQAASGATSISVEPLASGIASGAQIAMSNGQVVTLSGAAAAGARTIPVNATGAIIPVESVGLALASPSMGLPFTPNGGNATATLSNGENRIFRLARP